LEQYEHGGDIYGNPGVMLDFSVSINPLGMPEAVNKTLVTRVSEFSRYPDPYCRELVSAIVAYENIPKDWILCGNGAADLIYRLCHAARPRLAVVCAPTFSEYRRAMEQVGCMVTHHKLLSENGFMLTEKLSDCITTDVDMLFLCNPNNPTGRLIPNDMIKRILTRARQTGTIVVLDECFLDFTVGESAKRHLAEMPGLVILKAFTKMYAMAGLRLGYMLTSDIALLEKVSAVAQCWSVSVPAQIAGVAALGCGDWQDKTRRLVAEERRYLTESLACLGIEVLPSDCNFLLLRTKQLLYEQLLQKGILIRQCGNFVGLDSSYYRIGIKTRSENAYLMSVIKGII